LKLWLLDADVIIDLLDLGIFDTLVKNAEIFASETVAGEVKSYNQGLNNIQIDFKATYVATGKVATRSVPVCLIEAIRSTLPGLRRESIDLGELESLAVLQNETALTFCSCDAAAIRALPFMGCSERGISTEQMLKLSGLSAQGLKERHTEKYFRNNLEIGKELKVQSFGTGNKRDKVGKGPK